MEKSEFLTLLADGTIIFRAVGAVSRAADQTAGEAKERPHSQTTLICLAPHGPAYDLGEKMPSRLRYSDIGAIAHPANPGAKLWMIGPRGVWIFDTSPQKRNFPEQFYAASLGDLDHLYPRAISKTGQIFFKAHGTLWQMDLRRLIKLKPSDPQLNTKTYPPWPL